MADFEPLISVYYNMQLQKGNFIARTRQKKKSVRFGRPFSIMGENYVMKLYGLIITAQVKDYFNPKLRFS